MSEANVNLSGLTPWFCPECRRETPEFIGDLDWRCPHCKHRFQLTESNWEKACIVTYGFIKDGVYGDEDEWEARGLVACVDVVPDMHGQPRVVDVIASDGRVVSVTGSGVELFDFNYKPATTNAATVIVHVEIENGVSKTSGSYIRAHRCMNLPYVEASEFDMSWLTHGHARFHVDLEAFSDSVAKEAGMTPEQAIAHEWNKEIARGEYVETRYHERGNTPYAYHWVQGDFLSLEDDGA